MIAINLNQLSWKKSLNLNAFFLLTHLKWVLPMADRLDRIERILETTLSLTQQCRQDLIQTDQMIKLNAAAIARLDKKMNQFIEQSAQDREIIKSKMRRLRTEMQRLIETSFG